MPIFSIINKYISKDFLKTVFNVTFIFLALTTILNLFEEINYFKDHDVGLLLPLMMSVLKVSSLIDNLFPFIILISTIYVFYLFLQSDEINAIRTAGISNFKIILIPSFFSLIIGVVIIVAFNPVLSVLTEKYYTIKNEYTQHSDYLAAITVNGIWIKEQNIDTKRVNFLRALKIEGKNLVDVSIYQFDENHNAIRRIEAEKANIETFNWNLQKVKIYEKDQNTKIDLLDNYVYTSSYNLKSIKSLYSNLKTVSFWDLKNLINTYKERGYSTREVEIKLQKSLAFPFFLLSMSLLAGTCMMGVNFRGKYVGYIFFAIMTSIVVYFFNDFSSALGDTGKLPIVMSVWMPILIIFLLSSIGLIHVNQK